MCYTELCHRIDEINNKGFSNCIIKKRIGSKEIFLMNSAESGSLQTVHKMHIDFKERNRELFDKIYDATNDKVFRDFLFSNSQFILQEIQKSFGNKHIEPYSYDDTKMNIYDLAYVGFSDGQLINDDDKISDFIDRLSTDFLVYMNKLNGKYTKQYGIQDLVSSFKKLLDLIGITNYYYKKDVIFVEVKDSRLVNFLLSWQLHQFFEDYINRIFANESGLEPINNPLIFINPLIDNNKHLRGYIELDGCLYAKDTNLIFIECKNSNNVKEENLFPFLGKTRLIEELYEIKIANCFVSTGSGLPIVWGFNKFGSNKIKVFDRSDYRSNYRELKAFAKTFK